MDREISQDKGNGHLAFVTPKANTTTTIQGSIQASLLRQPIYLMEPGAC